MSFDLARQHLRSAWHEALAIFAPMNNRTGRQAKRWRQKYGAQCELADFEARVRRKAVHAQRALADFESRLLRLGPGDVCLDLGANVGTITQRMAATGASVHAYEPDPVAFAALVGNVGHLPNVTLHQAAVAAAAGRGLLRRHTDFAVDPLVKSTGSSLVRNRPSIYAGGEELEVEVRAFHAVLDAVGGRVALVKMDIEGSEFDILRAIFADPGAYDFEALFCETHEFDLVDEEAAIKRMIRAADSLDRPRINLYWP